MSLVLTTFKTTNVSYFPLVSLKPAWKLDVPSNPWDDLLDYLVANVVVGFAVNAKAHNSTSQSIPNNVETALSFDSNDFNVGSIHSTTVNPTRFTVPSTGVYSIFGLYRASSNATGTRYAAIKKNGSVYLSINWSAVSASSDTSINVGLIETLTAGDYIELYAFQTSGGALNAVTGASNTFMSIAQIG